MRNISPRSFFIIGCPRTGTTLLRRILNSHSFIAIPPESLFIYEYIISDSASLDQKKEMLCKEPAFESWDIELTLADLSSCHSIVDCLVKAHQKYALANGKYFWGHKTQTLIRYADQIAKSFPDCVFIHTVRDSRAVVNSLKKSKSHRLNVLMGSRRYNLDTNLGIAFEHLYPHRCRRVIYEELIQNPHKTIIGLCEWIGIHYEPTMLTNRMNHALRFDAAEVRNDHHRNVNTEINPLFADKWKHELSDHEIIITTSLTYETMNKLDYKIFAQDYTIRNSLLLLFRIQHFFTVAYLLIRNFWARPFLWRIINRKIKLKTLSIMFFDLFRGR